MHQQVPCTRKKMVSWAHGLIAWCKLAPTLARQMWRHNYVIDRNEYLIFTLSESVNPWIYSLQFLFKSTNNSWRYERKCEWVFFSEQCILTTSCIFLHIANKGYYNVCIFDFVISFIIITSIIAVLLSFNRFHYIWYFCLLYCLVLCI